MDDSDDDENILNQTQVQITPFGVEYPCMQNRKSLEFDEMNNRYNTFKIKQSQNIDANNKKEKKKRRGSINEECFICDIYMVSNVSLRRRYLGYSTLSPEQCLIANESSNHSQNGLKYCILEKVGRTGIKGLMQTDLIFELQTDSKALFSAIKNLQQIGLIIAENDMVFTNCNRLWLAQYKFRDNIRALTDYNVSLVNCVLYKVPFVYLLGCIYRRNS